MKFWKKVALMAMITSQVMGYALSANELNESGKTKKAVATPHVTQRYEGVIHQNKVIRLDDGSRLDLRKAKDVTLWEPNVVSEKERNVFHFRSPILLGNLNIEKNVEKGKSSYPDHLSVIAEFTVRQLKGEDEMARHVAYVVQVGMTKQAHLEAMQYILPEHPLFKNDKELEARLLAEYRQITHYGVTAYNDMVRKQIQLFLKKGLAQVESSLQQFSKEEFEMEKALLLSSDITIRSIGVSEPIKKNKTLILPISSRVTLSQDGFIFPVAIFSWLTKEDDKVVLTMIYMNDASYDFWLPRLEKMTGLSLKEVRK